MGPFIKFGVMTSFIILVLTKYEECVDDGSTHSIPQTKQKSEECENDGLPHSSTKNPINVWAPHQQAILYPRFVATTITVMKKRKEPSLCRHEEGGSPPAQSLPR